MIFKHTACRLAFLASLAFVLSSSAGCLAEDDFSSVERAASDAAKKFYASVARMNCIKGADGKEKGCSADGDCGSGQKCDTNCADPNAAAGSASAGGCCVAKPPALDKKNYCRYKIVACDRGTTTTTGDSQGYIDSNGIWQPDDEATYAEEDPTDPDGEPHDPADPNGSGGHTYAGDPADPADPDDPADDGATGCSCVAPGAETGHGYFGECLADATKTTTANCQYPPASSTDPECVGQYCVFEMKVAAGSCCDPSDPSCTAPNGYAGSECGGKSCKGNRVASCDRTGGTWVKKADCGTLALPSK